MNQDQSPVDLIKAFTNKAADSLKRGATKHSFFTAELPIELIETRTGVIIGSKFNGPREHRDTGEGTFFSTMPVIDGFMEKLQAQILEWTGAEYKRVRKAIREGGYTDMPERPWPQPEHGKAWTRFATTK